MKKLLVVLLALLMLVGCGQGGKSDDGETVVIYQNENVRKAIAYAIDREALAKSLNDGSVGAEGIIPFKLASNPETGKDFREDQGSVVAYDVDAAKGYYETALEELNKMSLKISRKYFWMTSRFGNRVKGDYFFKEPAILYIQSQFSFY